MDVRVEDVCVVTGYRLTEYQVFDDNELVNTYFSIRNNEGAVLGSNFDDNVCSILRSQLLDTTTCIKLLC